MTGLLQALPLPAPAPYVREAVVTGRTDGDTLPMMVDMGFRLWAQLGCRIVRIDAPEKWDAAAYRASGNYLAQLCPTGCQLTVQSVCMTDKYGGRFDGHVWLPDGRDLAAVMVAAGHARVWAPGAPKPYPLHRPTLRTEKT